VPVQAELVYEAGSLEIDADRRELRARGVPVPIGGRAFEIIEALARSAGELVTKDELMLRVWPGAIVEESTIQVHISAIRKALGPDRVMLKTSSGRGYRLLGRWTTRQRDTREGPVHSAPAGMAAKLVQSNLPIAPSGSDRPGGCRETRARPYVRLSDGNADRPRRDRQDEACT
jgi:DNA-binding winged helix-turn-helix (wHTH) protein